MPLPKNEEENNAFKAVGGLLDATDLDFDGVWKDSFGNVVNYFGPFTSWSKDEGYYMNGVADSGEWSKSKNVGKPRVYCQIHLTPRKPQVHTPPTPVEGKFSCYTGIKPQFRV